MSKQPSKEFASHESRGKFALLPQKKMLTDQNVDGDSSPQNNLQLNLKEDQ